MGLRENVALCMNDVLASTLLSAGLALRMLWKLETTSLPPPVCPILFALCALYLAVPNIIASNMTFLLLYSSPALP